MFTLTEALARPTAQVGAETQRLARFADQVPAAFVTDAAFEESFYRNANLPETLGRLFAAVNPRRIDEDALEPLCAQAQAMLRGSSLLDDHVQLFYRALANAGLGDTTLHLRRPDSRRAETARTHPPGMEALHALKRLWASDWRFEAVLARLDESGSVALEARPTLLIAGEPGQPDPTLATALGAAQAWSNALGLVGLSD